MVIRNNHKGSTAAKPSLNPPPKSFTNNLQLSIKIKIKKRFVRFIKKAALNWRNMFLLKKRKKMNKMSYQIFN